MFRALGWVYKLRECRGGDSALEFVVAFMAGGGGGVGRL